MGQFFSQDRVIQQIELFLVADHLNVVSRGEKPAFLFLVHDALLVKLKVLKNRSRTFGYA